MAARLNEEFHTYVSVKDTNVGDCISFKIVIQRDTKLVVLNLSYIGDTLFLQFEKHSV